MSITAFFPLNRCNDTLVEVEYYYNFEESDNETGTITLSYQEDKEFVVLHVKDDGKPIENKNILFEPFKTTKTKGNGLGLALSLQIIQAHNGKIELLEETKGFAIKIAY